jgi:hypothetical protein
MSDAEFAKTHLRDHLGSLIVHPISEGFWSIYNTSKDLCQRNNQLDQILRTFQNMLTKITEWSDNTLDMEVDRIVKTTKCDYLDDLLMGVFISYMKSFASLHYRGNSSEIKIDFERPSLSKFVHELYKASARKLWQVAYLFKTFGISTEQQAKNRQDIEKHISDCMEQVIRGFLPWAEISRKYFSNTAPEPEPEPEVESESESESDDGESVSKNVSFGPESESEEEEEEEPKLKISEEDGILDFQDLDEKKEDLDPLKEIESRVQEETLVLNL